MNPFQYEVTCDVCGGTGLGTSRTAAAEWRVDSVITHCDPRVCIANLRRQQSESEKNAVPSAPKV